MTDVYSPVLAASLAFVVGTLLCLISGRVSRSSHLRRLSVVGASLSLAGMALALTSHVVLGHPAGGESGLGPIAFAAEHPLAVGVALATVGLFVVSLGEARAAGSRAGPPERDG